jgi:hypothetical protein
MGGSSYESMASAERELEGEQYRGDDDIIIPWRNGGPSILASSGEASDNIEMEGVGEPYQSLVSQQKQSDKTDDDDDDDDDAPTSGHWDEPDADVNGTSNGTLPVPKYGKSEQTSPTLTNGSATAAATTTTTIAHHTTHLQGRDERPQVLSHVDHIRMAVKIAPVWFLSNFFYNTSLAYTSITSSTVLASTGSLFTFLFAVSCGDERFTTPKLLGVILCFTGSVLTGLSDVESDNNNLTLVTDTTGVDGLGRILNNMKPTASLSTVATRIILSGADRSGDNGGDSLGGLVLGDLAGLISVSVC